MKTHKPVREKSVRSLIKKVKDAWTSDEIIQKRTSEYYKECEENSNRMAEIAVIDSVADGMPYYLYHGGEKGVEHWTPQAAKVLKLYKKAHPFAYWYVKIACWLGGE